jgi:hypothetical protein
MGNKPHPILKYKVDGELIYRVDNVIGEVINLS